ncbi:MAG TPA: DUF4199 domain-containing protein [Chitinophagaceae bacterium]|nr:DUF4199 domain-containing protein [Chitinophagaceae bacterium]
MLPRISPALKGIISSASMIVAMFILYNQGSEMNPRLLYMVYAIYGIGIIWTILSYRQSAAFTGRFVDLFSQGFKCFIVVTLCIALFYGIFNYLHPEFKEKTAALLKEQLSKLTGEKQMLPTQIEDEVAAFKKQYILKLVSGAIFGYLIIGAAVTATAAAFLSKRIK